MSKLNESQTVLSLSRASRPNGWKNPVYFGDNLPILKRMDAGSVNPIYVDPPFNTGTRQERVTYPESIHVGTRDGEETRNVAR